MKRTRYYILVFIVISSFLSACAQINRDNLRYSSVKRGSEIYKITSKDSLEAAKNHSDKEIDLYKKRIEDSNAVSQKVQSEKEKVEPKILPSSSDEKEKKKPNVSSTSQIEILWPRSVIEKIEPNKTKDELIMALSSTASIAQMRDLLTEPSFPPLLPLERNIELGCLPPPDSAAFEAVSKLSGVFKKEGVLEASLTGEFASSVVKLFEESERTLFLQYALFRLCEMSVNAPSEFRNIHPVILHDIVRRTAEMNQLATKESEMRRAEEEKTKQEKEKTKQRQLEFEIGKTVLDKNSLYYSCIKAKLSAGVTDNTRIISECNDLVNSKPKAELL